MKKILLICLCGWFYPADDVHAQVSQGTGFVGATISFNTVGQKNNNNDAAISREASINAAPSFQVGHFIRENQMIGVGVGSNLQFATYKSEFNGSENKTQVSDVLLSLSPYFRQYKTLGTKWALFLQASASGSYRMFTAKGLTEKNKENGFGAGLQVLPGITYRITPRFALESDINLLSLGVNFNRFDKNNNFSFASIATSSLTNYFSIRAAWYIQRP